LLHFDFISVVSCIMHASSHSEAGLAQQGKPGHGLTARQASLAGHYLLVIYYSQRHLGNWFILMSFVQCQFLSSLVVIIDKNTDDSVVHLFSVV